MPFSRATRSLADLAPGDHLCWLFQGEEHRAVVVPFIRHGLDRGEKVLYIADVRTADAILEVLRADGVDADPFLTCGQLCVLSAADTYVREGYFDPDRMISDLQAETTKALAEGYAALRVTGEMSWAIRGIQGSERLVEYEIKLNHFFPESACLGLCQYDRRRFEPALLLDILHSHPLILIGTQVCENPYYLPPTAFLENRPAVRLDQWLQALTETQRAEAELRESEERHRSLFENSLDAVLLTIPDGRILAANPAACRMFGRSEEEICRVGRAGLVDLSDPRVEAAVAERQRIGCAHAEFTMVRGDGTRFLAEVSSGVFKTKDGALQTSMVIRDISEPKAAEEAVRTASAYARSLIEASLDPLVTIDVAGRITDVNVATERATGVARDRLIGSDFTDYFSEPERARAGYRQVFDEGNVTDYRLTMRHTSGRCMDVLYNATLYHNEAGDVAGVFAAARDVTQQKRAEEALRASEEKYRTLFEESFDGLFITSPAGRILDMNKKGVRMFGYDTKEEILSLDLEQDVYAHAPDRKRILAMVNARGTAEYEVVVKKKSGETMVTHCSLTAVRDEAGGITSYRGIISDITERKRAEEALRSRTRQLEAIRTVTAEITRELDLTALLRLIVRRATELVGMNAGVIYLWDQEAEVLIPQAWEGLGEWMAQYRLRLGQGVAGTAAQRREGLIVHDYRTWSAAVPFILERTQITAVLAEPLLYRDRLLGVITLTSEEPGQAFQEDDRELLGLFASPAAIAIENARLYAGVVRRSEETTALLRASRSLMAGLDLQETLRRIVEEAARIARSLHVKVLLRDREKQTLRLGAMVGRPPGILSDFARGNKGSLSAIVASTGQPLFVADCTHDSRNPYTDQDRELGIVTYLGLPITMHGEVDGVLTVNTCQPREYTSEEVEYLASFANLSAIAIENARLFEEVQAGRERLEILSRRQLEIQEEERRLLARELHDEIGQLLTGLKLTLEMAASQGADSGQGVLRESRDLVGELIRQVRELSLNLRPPILDDLGLLPALLWQFERYTAHTQIRVDFEHAGLEGRPCSPDVETAAYRIVQEALTNVVRHAEVDAVLVRIRAEPERLVLQVEDRGRGFDPSVGLTPGASSGLAGMRERARLLGGWLRVESSPAAGTRIAAGLPMRVDPEASRRS